MNLITSNFIPTHNLKAGWKPVTKKGDDKKSSKIYSKVVLKIQKIEYNIVKKQIKQTERN